MGRIGAEVVALTGRPPDVKYTEAQADAIIRLWHQKNPKYTPLQIVPMVESILGLPEDRPDPEEFFHRLNNFTDMVIDRQGQSRRCSTCHKKDRGDG